TDGDGSHGSTSKTPSYTKSVSWQHHPFAVRILFNADISRKQWVFCSAKRRDLLDKVFLRSVNSFKWEFVG
ncbi:hypothetical protein, partial [Citrobacter freundii]|uniref:hypothetical protein n=1 Tax=Citrobacter freundii TaxID=546 RepID=UPI003A97F8AA